MIITRDHPQIPKFNVNWFTDDTISPTTIFMFDSYIFPYLHAEYRMGIRHNPETCKTDRRRYVTYKTNQQT